MPTRQIPSESCRALPGDKCHNCKQPAAFVVGRVTKKAWCASGSYTRKGSGWCWACWDAWVEQHAREEAARLARLDELKARRDWKKANGLALTDEDFD